MPLRRVMQLALGPIFLVAVGAVLFPSGGRDDAHIGYWVARQLAATGHIVNYNGAAFEQSSSLLHVLVLGAAGWLAGSGVSMIVLGRVSALVFGLAAVFAVQRLASRIQPRLVAATGLLTASSAYFIYWSYGGMESTLGALTALGMILAFGAYLKARPASSGISGTSVLGVTLASLAFVLTRPENPLVLGGTLVAAGAMLFCLNRGPDPDGARRVLTRRFLALIAVSFIVAAAVFAFRWHAFGSLFPQPVAAKSGHWGFHKLAAGVRYCRSVFVKEPGAGIFALAALAGAGGAAREHWRRGAAADPHVIVALAFLCVDGAFVVFAGGDWMEAGRFFVPWWPVAALFAAFGLDLLARGAHARWAKPALFAVAVAQLWAIYGVAAHRSMSLPLWSQVTAEPYAGAARAAGFSWFERHDRVNLRDIPTIARLDDIVSRLQPLKTHGVVCVMSHQLGMVFYHVLSRHPGRVHVLDQRGLIDPTLTDCPLLAGLSRTSGGVQLDLDFYFAHRAQLEARCAVPRPDVIFDVGTFPEVAAADYAVVYTQGGELRTDSRRLPGAVIHGDQFIAVRKEWLAALGE